MTDLILDNTYLILLLPLWIFLIIMGGRFFSVYVNKNIIYALTLISSLSGIILSGAGLREISVPVEQTFSFIKILNFSVPFGLRLDRLSLIIALTLFIVSFIVQLFTIFYLKNEKKIYRFFAFLNMFNFSMAGLIFSPNLFQMYVFWELVGVISYLLIGFEYSQSVKSIASRRVFLMNRIGDTFLIAAILVVSAFMYEYAGNFSFAALSLEDFNAISTLFYAYASEPIYLIICVCFILGASVKSAQFPFYIWLQDAMEAKLPVSALLHSATMVVAGVYLIIRLLPFFILDERLMLLISVIGICTALICSFLASVEFHPKKILAYSTSANLGLMFFALGLGNVKAALILLVAHALLKSMLFLLLPDGNKLSHIQAFSFLIGTLSLSGLILTGFVAKEFIFNDTNGYLSVLYCTVSFLGAFYLTRLYVLITKEKQPDKIVWGEYLPSALLLLLTICLYVYLKKHGGYRISLPFYSALAAWIAVYFLQTKNLLFKCIELPKLSQKLYYSVIPKIYATFSCVSNYIDVNIFGNYKPICYITRCGVRLIDFIEINIMNKAVSFINTGCKKISQWDLIMQSGNVQTYNAYAFIIVTTVVCLVIAGYTYILNMMS